MKAYLLVGHNKNMLVGIGATIPDFLTPCRNPQNPAWHMAIQSLVESLQKWELQQRLIFYNTDF